ncbi:MAG TPA: hypothetical protein VHX37_11330 [Acidobacteriaceae bacterium]|jgi:hypothetical protein|nr:hypothetical protein [Acidobacteriaceae bacterium]
MSNSGWVAIRRGLLDHVTTGRLTPSEYLVLVQLLLLADAGTGGGTINGPTLLHWTGHAFSLDTAQRILVSLHKKRYIWYHGVRAKVVQPYWVNKYRLTKGPKSLRITNLSQLFDKVAISDAEVLELAVEVGGEVADEVRGDPSDDYKKETENDKYKKNSLSIRMQSLDVITGSKGEMQAAEAAHIAQARCHQVHQVNAPPDCITQMHHSDASPPASPIKYVPQYGTPLGPATVREQDAGLRWSGADGGYYDHHSQRIVPHAEAIRRLGIQVNEGVTNCRY